MEGLTGYHAEWNLGCPGGWEYQRMAQVRGKLCWKRVKERSGIDVELDFDHPFLNPVPAFVNILLRAHRAKFQDETPFILLVAEADTLDKVTENINLVAFLNGLTGVNAALTSPEAVEKSGEDITYQGNRVTVIFLDMNTDVLVKTGERHSIQALLAAVRKGIVVNPRGMEPIGSKGVFEAVTGEFRSVLSRTTVAHTPWTRMFYPRKTEGPDGELISDLLEWVRTHREGVILKPVHGYSGAGIFVGPQSQSWDADIETALKAESYIVQSFVPKGLWAEEYPWLDRENRQIILKQWQTDFRCLIGDQGLMGFLARFGGVPTNVGAGGGNQSAAIIQTDMSVKQAVDSINKAIMGLGYDTVAGIQEEVDRKGMALGHTYLEGPTPTTLRPRIITKAHHAALVQYSAGLWNDFLQLEKLWQAGKLDHVVQMGEAEAGIARMQPWGGSPALAASDGLFSFYR